jgi:hypothetical protein
MINKEKILSCINLIDDLISYSEKLDFDKTNEIKKHMIKLVQDLENGVSEIRK